MNEKKTDRRVKRTHAMLRESLLTILKEKPINKITPTELCRRADINRNTFYSHYDSVEALLHSIENDFFEQIRQSLEHSLRNNSIAMFLSEICQVIKANRDLCRVLLSENGNKDFLRDMISSAYDKSIAEWRSAGLKGNGDQSGLLYTFFVNGSVSVIQSWIQSDLKKEPDEIARFIMQATYSGLESFINENA